MVPRVTSGDQDAAGRTSALETLRRSSAFRGPVEPATGHEHALEHFALVYETCESQLQAAIPFIQQGLDRGERCLYIADDNARKTVVAAMRDHGIDVDTALESGALSIHTKEDTYLQTGTFDREAMLEFWETTLEAAKQDEGYAGIRAAAEMTWALDESTSLDNLAEYEAMLNSIFEDEDYAVLCQYNRERFPTETIRAVIRTHPYLIQDDRVSHNAFYTPPEEYFTPDRSAREVDQMMETLHERAETKAALAERKEYFEQIFERSHDAILIIDPEADEILDANPAASEMLGYTRDELLSRGPSDIHPDEMQMFRNFVTGVFEDGRGWTEELTCRTKRGNRIPAEISAARIDHGARPIMLAAVRDISERKEHERFQQRLYEIAADTSKPFAEKLQALFDLGCERFEMEFGGIARIDPDTDLFAVEHINGEHEYLVPGEQYPLSETYCRLAHSDGEPAAVTDPASKGFEGSLCYDQFGIEAYLGSRLDIDGDVDRTLFFVSNEPRTDDFSEAERTFHHLMSQWVQYELERRQHERYQRELYEIAADTDRTFGQKLKALFDLGCERFDLELGGLARIDPETDTFEVEAVSDDHEHLQPGAQVALSETYCRVLGAPGETVGITDPTDDNLDEMLAYTEFGVEAYLGTRIELEDDLDRTLFFVSSDTRETQFSENERTFHHLMGQWVQYELERRRKTDQLAALNNLNTVIRDINQAVAQQSTRDEIERVVCERLADSDSYEFAWVGTVDEQTREITPATSVNAGGYLDGVTITADDSVTGRGPAGRAIRTGESQFVQNAHDQLEYEPWRERVGDRGVGAIASIPIAYEEQSYGVLNVYTDRENGFEGEEREVVSQLGEIIGLSITAVEREQQLRHERERLEFINRLIRHNLLNSLNVVQARADILEGHVDPAVDAHLDTVRKRTDEMIDLIETLRSLMRAIVEEELDLEPLDLGPVLRNEIRQTRQAFDEAVFEVNTDLDAVPAVLADDLLEEVFENLLVNAVQHNDTEQPRVTIDVDADDESVTVSVADNGPGVPPEMKDHIFEKGTKGFESPGTGFGLHLVREIVDMYDGTITVEDNEPTGAVFSMTLPRAGET